MGNCLNIFGKKENNFTLDPLVYGKFDLDNINGIFYVESVYDGDTITLLIPTKLSIYNMVGSNCIDLNSNTNPSEQIILNKVRVRLYGIDTPELKPRKDLPNRAEYIAKAKEAKDYLSGLISNKLVKVKFMSDDKYGRPLVKIFDNKFFYGEQKDIWLNLYGKDNKTNEIELNSLMIKKGFAKEYNGGTKDILIQI